MKNLLLTLAILLALPLAAQQIRRGYVYQYSGADSTSQKVVIKKRYNRKGKVTVENYDGYKEHINSSPEYFTRNTYYSRDTLVRKVKTVAFDGNRIVCIYRYNRHHRMSSMRIVYRKVVAHNDIVRERTTYFRKKFEATCFYSYDKQGKMEKIWLTKPLPIMETSYKRLLFYDDSARMRSAYEFKENGDTLSVDTFTYYNHGYTALQQYYPLKNSLTDSTFYTTDTSGKTTEKRVIPVGSGYRYRILYTYFPSGMVRKEEEREIGRSSRISHIYTYEQGDY